MVRYWWFFAAARNQGGATNVNLLNGIGQGDIGPGNGLLKRVEIHHHQVKGANVII